jgi:hypothetical protein
MCGRHLSSEEDPLSGDCGGDCWGCVGFIEAEIGYEPSQEAVRREIEAGLRETNGRPKRGFGTKRKCRTAREISGAGGAADGSSPLGRTAAHDPELTLALQ